MVVSFDFSWKFGADHMPSKIVSESIFDVGRILPLSSNVRAAIASISVIEKVDWKPCWLVLAVGITS
jgi:hypothetical protein